MSYNHAEYGSEKDNQGGGQPSTTGIERGTVCPPMTEGVRSEPIRLFHGNSEARLHKIKKVGIIPRSASDAGNFEGEIASLAGQVYLTGCYPLFYAEHASPALTLKQGFISRRNAKRVVLEIDRAYLDPLLLRPDEDALRQYLQTVEMVTGGEAGRAAARKLFKESFSENRWAELLRIVELIPGGAESVTTDVEAMRELWPYSFQLLGSVAYRGVIPPEAILQYAEIDSYHAAYIMQWGCNMDVNIFKHVIVQSSMHEQLARLVMDGTALEPIQVAKDVAKDVEREVREDLRHKFWIDEADRVKAMAQREKGVRVYTPAARPL